MQYSRYVGDLVDSIRRDTQNAADVPTATTQRGIQTQDIVRYLNYAQHSLERIITSLYPFVFTGTQTFPLDSTNLYDITDNVYLDLRVKKVEYSRTGLEKDYQELAYRNDLERFYSPYGYPQEWMRVNGGAISLNPVPASSTSGNIRVTYQRALDSMGVRVGQITSVTLTSNILQTLTINTATDDTAPILEAANTAQTPLCITSAKGVPILYNQYFSAYDIATGVFTLTPLTISPVRSTRPPTIGDYITIGSFTTTHSQLPYLTEAYLVEWASRKLKMRVTSPQDWKALELSANRLAGEIVEAYKVGDSTAVKTIPLSSYSRSMLTIPGRNGRY